MRKSDAKPCRKKRRTQRSDLTPCGKKREKTRKSDIVPCMKKKRADKPHVSFWQNMANRSHLTAKHKSCPKNRPMHHKMLGFRTKWTTVYRKRSGSFYRNAPRRRTDMRSACTKASRKSTGGTERICTKVSRKTVREAETRCTKVSRKSRKRCTKPSRKTTRQVGNRCTKVSRKSRKRCTKPHRTCREGRAGAARRSAPRGVGAIGGIWQRVGQF